MLFMAENKQAIPGLVDAIIENRLDTTAYLVLADALEEEGDSELAEYIRLVIWQVTPAGLFIQQVSQIRAVPVRDLPWLVQQGVILCLCREAANSAIHRDAGTTFQMRQGLGHLWDALSQIESILRQPNYQRRLLGGAVDQLERAAAVTAPIIRENGIMRSFARGMIDQANRRMRTSGVVFAVPEMAERINRVFARLGFD